MTLIPKSWPAWAEKAVAIVGGAGVGATISITLIDKEHHFIVETFRAWGAPSLLGLVALLLVSQIGSRVIDLVNQGSTRVLDLGEKMLQVGADNAASQQRLADAVQQLADKDDREKEEQRRLLSYVGSQQEKILQKLEQMSESTGKSRGATA